MYAYLRRGVLGNSCIANSTLMQPSMHFHETERGFT